MTDYEWNNAKNAPTTPWSSTREQIENVVIGERVTSIGKYAFYQCSSLTSITIPNSVTTIGEWAFRECSSLTSIAIPNSVTTIGEYAFSYCSSLTSITIPNSVTTIGEWAFDGDYLRTATLPKRFENRERDIFWNCCKLRTINWI